MSFQCDLISLALSPPKLTPPPSLPPPPPHHHHGQPNPEAATFEDDGYHDHAVTLLLVAWGQFVDHDITRAAETKDPT